ncbi:MAG: MFS transporter [Cellvibrionales bacterium]|nr:MFS transporter [Cellvibrionales bacterium]
MPDLWDALCSPTVRRTVRLFFLGFAAGLPLLLIFSTLSLWLGEAGVEKSAVTYFSWAALGYSCKFIWAPIVDKLPLPLLSAGLGRRRGWLLAAQLAVIAAIVGMAFSDPAAGLIGMACAAVALGFASATQDIVIDAYRIECAGPAEQALLSSGYIAGYRIGMVVAGAGSLYLAEFFGSGAGGYAYAAWQKTYLLMAAVMGVGVATTLLIPEPAGGGQSAYPHSNAAYVRFFALFVLAVGGMMAVLLGWSWLVAGLPGGAGVLGAVKAEGAPLLMFAADALKLSVALAAAVFVWALGMRLRLVDRRLAVDGYWRPVRDFFRRYGRLACWVLLLVGTYRISDIVMGTIANLFYQDLGYSKSQIADVAKVFGLLMTIAGSFLGGLLALRLGVVPVLLAGAVLAPATNLLFVWLAAAEPTVGALTLAIAADNLSAGLAAAAFVAWLSSLTSVSFTATQYAIFSSLMTLLPKLLGGYSGTLVEQLGYADFFLLTAGLGVPVILLVGFLARAVRSSP